MQLNNKILSDITVFGKYSRYLPKEGRRETWTDIISRNEEMHIKKYPILKEQIKEVYERSVYTKNMLPSMRSLQFGGAAIERNPIRIYNCAYLPVESLDAFSEIMLLLLGGTGVGYSVQYRHVNKLPKVKGTHGEERRYVVGDSIEGWADAVKVLVESYFLGKDQVRFDYSDIRDKGTELVISGGKAPGPDPLRLCLVKIEDTLRNAKGRRLQPIECHDICCYLADAVLAGGIRRAAMISLFSIEDVDMLTCKSGSWWEENPQRGRANNSVTLVRGQVKKKEFFEIWKRVKASGAGEPGFYWTNNPDWGTNPCCEIALKPYQFCNLVEVNASTVDGQDDLDTRVRDASFIATLQAGYTDFHYLRPIWKKTTEEEALIGVGITGIASNRLGNLDLRKAAQIVKDTNYIVASTIGVNPAARSTTVKPAGTSSLVMGTSSGIHAWHNDYYVRRLRFGKDEDILKYLNKIIPELVEDEYFNPNHQSVVSIPQMAPEGSSVRTESVYDLLERVAKFNKDWVGEGHREGDNKNNVSCTISLKEDEWEGVGQWMWSNRNGYNGISVLPYDGGTYIQAPFEDITKERYEELEKMLSDIDLSKVYEEEDNTDLSGEAACAGGACEVTFV